MAGVQGFRLILASASPRRRELLAQAGYAFTVEAADVDESERVGEAPEAYVRRLAEEKARAVLGRFADPTLIDKTDKDGAPGVLIVLGADTTVVCDGEMLAKPADAADAKRMLLRLSGRTHEVMTGVAAATRAGMVSGVETTSVTFSEIPETELDFYCATQEPMDKAGAYGIQGYAARWVPRIDGDYFNVMGLPIARVVRLVEEVGESASPAA
ncbi:MAG: nucleoside triphosphate pyrophosphatase [Acidobacteriaceae bacterium]|jgi:septum formation protein